MSKRPITDALIDDWLEPATSRPDIRRDLRKHADDARHGRRELAEANERLARFREPVFGRMGS